MANDKLVRLSDVLSRAHNASAYNPKTHEEIEYVVVEAEDIKAIPAVDAVEVRHGHWVTEEEAIEKDDYSLRDTCSVCGHCDWDCTESENFNFCPNCGAKMSKTNE